MAIVKLIEFAKEGKKSIAGLVMLSGFPREEKPAREWFNYLFNMSFNSINDLIDELNQMRIELDYLKKNGALPDTPETGGTPPPVTLPPLPDPDGGNITGTWTVTQLTSPLYGQGGNLAIGNVVYLAKHSSGRKVKDVVMSWKQNHTDPISTPTTYTSQVRDSDDKGEITFTFMAEYYVPYAPTALVTIAAPNNTTFRGNFTLYAGVPGGGFSDGSYAGGE